MNMDNYCFELLGILTVAILTIEVAVYAIVASLSSRITRYTEEEFAAETDRVRGEIKGIMAQATTSGLDDNILISLNERLNELESKKGEREKIRKRTGLWRALFLPVIFAILGVFATGIGSYLNSNFWFLFVGIGLLSLSVVFEMPLLLTINKVAKWRDDGGYNELKKIIEDIRTVSMRLYEKTFEEQVNTSKILIKKVGALTASMAEQVGVVKLLLEEFREKMGLKKAEILLNIFDIEGNELEEFHIEVGEEYKYSISITNKSHYAMTGSGVDLILPEGFSLGEKAPNDGSRIPRTGVLYPGGAILEYDTGILPPGYNYTAGFMIKCDIATESVLKIFISSITHERVVFGYPIVAQ